MNWIHDIGDPTQLFLTNMKKVSVQVEILNGSSDRDEIKTGVISE